MLWVLNLEESCLLPLETIVSIHILFFFWWKSIRVTLRSCNYLVLRQSCQENQGDTSRNQQGRGIFPQLNIPADKYVMLSSDAFRNKMLDVKNCEITGKTVTNRHLYKEKPTKQNKKEKEKKSKQYNAKREPPTWGPPLLPYTRESTRSVFGTHSSTVQSYDWGFVIFTP